MGVRQLDVDRTQGGDDSQEEMHAVIRENGK